MLSGVIHFPAVVAEGHPGGEMIKYVMGHVAMDGTMALG